jgi:hypothetical protein
MKSLFGKMIGAAALVCFLSGAGMAQTPSVDLFLTGGPNMGTYPGFVTIGSYNITFSNGSGVQLPAGAFAISLALPSGFEFDATYPGIPTGWSYNRTSATSVLLEPTTTVEGNPPFGIVAFSVPFKTTALVNAQTYQGQIYQYIPMYVDPNPGNNIPTGTVSVLNVPLPVTFETFEATAKSCSIALSWATVNEQSNDYFSLERSIDGVKFESVAKVKSQGSGAERREYLYKDEHPFKGKNHYRLVQYDVDGHSLVSKVVTASTDCSGASIDLFPNPVTNMVNVKGLQGKNTISVFNAAGQLIMEEDSELETHQLKTGHLASGAYHLQVVKGGQILFKGRFVKAE